MQITDTTIVRFASLDLARKILSTSDEFTQNMGARERAARLQLAGDWSEGEFLDFAADCAAEWQPEEMEKVWQSLEIFKERLGRLVVSFPPEVWLVRTTGREEGGSAYTRQNAIILPPRKLSYPRLEDFTALLTHELFHVITRYKPEFRDDIYTCIGFAPCGHVTLPGFLSTGRITNPDAPQNSHAIQVIHDGREIRVLPVLYSEVEESGDDFFHGMQCRLLGVEPSGQSWQPIMMGSGQPRLFTAGEVCGFFEQTGQTNENCLQPEEILANAFADMWDRPEEGINARILPLLLKREA